jgi:hypothetical protein
LAGPQSIFRVRFQRKAECGKRKTTGPEQHATIIKKPVAVNGLEEILIGQRNMHQGLEPGKHLLPEIGQQRGRLPGEEGGQ